MEQRISSAALAVLISLCGCILGAQPQTTTTTSFVASTSTTNPPTTSLPPTTTTIQDNKTATCIQARQMETAYKRCLQAAHGNLTLSPARRKQCAQIQRAAGQYLRQTFLGLKGCLGVPGDGLSLEARDATFCMDLGEQDVRDDCYMLVRICDRIMDRDLRMRCEGQRQTSTG
jgi:hypothetical protein